MEEKLWILSEGLKLEAHLAYDDDVRELRGRILICPPHPFLGGDMRNNVLRHLIPALAELGYAVLSFNYRGIGDSETDTDIESHQKEFWENSSCPDYENKIYLDSERVFSFLKKTITEDCPLSVIGYSFGCMPALSLMRKEDELRKGCFISPPLAKWKLNQQDVDVEGDKLFLYSPNDFACPREEMKDAFESFKEPKELKCIEGAGHFFVGQESQLTHAVNRFMGSLSTSF